MGDLFAYFSIVGLSFLLRDRGALTQLQATGPLSICLEIEQRFILHEKLGIALENWAMGYEKNV